MVLRTVASYPRLLGPIMFVAIDVATGLVLHPGKTTSFMPGDMMVLTGVSFHDGDFALLLLEAFVFATGDTAIFNSLFNAF